MCCAKNQNFPMFKSPRNSWPEDRGDHYKNKKKMIFFIFFGLKNSEKNHWFQRYITTWVKHFWKWAKNVKISYFWGKLAVWPKNSIFWHFWPISKILWPRLLYTVGISDFFLNFWDQKNKKNKKNIFFIRVHPST